MGIDMEGMQTRVADALSQAVGQEELVTKWVVLVESMSEDGTRGLWAVAQEGMKGYEVLGFLHYGMQIEQARQVTVSLKEAVEGED